MKKGIKIIFLFFLLFSCGKNVEYQKTHFFKNKKWQKEQKIKYTAEVKKGGAHNITFFLRTTTDYKYSNLWVFITTKTPKGKSKREPYEIKITNPDGSWVGKKTGTIVETPLYFKNKNLPWTGRYVFLVEQAITKSTIDEVLDLSLSIEKKTD